jgi:acetyl esterase/lipase
MPMTVMSRRASMLVPFGLAGLVSACATDMPPMPPADPSGRADPQMRAILESLAALKPRPVETLAPPEARLQPTLADAVRHRLREQGLPVAPRALPVVRDLEIPGNAGPLPARLYSPVAAPRAGQPVQPLPLIVYFHGGGFVLANLDTYDASARALAAEGHAIVLAVQYRKAPEHKFPAAHDDAYAAYVWALRNAITLGADLSRVAVVGESAGGNLALYVALAAREARVPLPVAMGLIYPIAGTDMNTPSYREFATAKPLNAAMMQWFMQYYTNGPAELQDTRLNVYGRAELRGLPKAVIVTAEIDPLNSDGVLLAQHLTEAGVLVKAQNYPGVTHEFFGADPTVLARAGEAQRFMGGELRSAFALPAPAVVVPQRRGAR